MSTASQIQTMAKQAETSPSERGAWITSAAVLAALGAVLLFLLGSAWFATGAGTDYPEPVATVTD